MPSPVVSTGAPADFDTVRLGALDATGTLAESGADVTVEAP